MIYFRLSSELWPSVSIAFYIKIFAFFITPL